MQIFQSKINVDKYDAKNEKNRREMNMYIYIHVHTSYVYCYYYFVGSGKTKECFPSHNKSDNKK